MIKMILALTLTVMSVTLMGQKISAPYLDQSGNECVLTWNLETGVSKLYYYDVDARKFVESDYQLSKRPSTDRGRFSLMPFVDQEGREAVLSWNLVTGYTRLYHYDDHEAKFVISSYQLPRNPTGDIGKLGFMAYKGKNGEERILAWNTETGVSKLYYYNEAKNEFLLSSYQLPVKPVAAGGECGFSAYLNKDGEESILAWNTGIGRSKLYVVDERTQKFKLSSHQLPIQSLGKGDYGFMPYLDKTGAECALAWNTASGVSKLYYYSKTVGQFKVSPYQLPSKPTGDTGTYGFTPFLNRHGAECILTWNTETGVSKMYRHDDIENNFLVSSHQLITIE